MNDTPRTDFIELGIPSWQLADNARTLDHARQLERELAECVGKYDGLVKILERKQDRIDVYERELAECQRRLNEFEHPRDPIDQPKPLVPLTV